jgi:hypothetical protein
MIDNEFFLSLNFHKSGLIKFKSRIRWFPNTHDTCPVHVLEPGKVVLLVSCLRNRNDIQLGRSVYEKYEIWGEQIELFAVPYMKWKTSVEQRQLNLVQLTLNLVTY